MTDKPKIRVLSLGAGVQSTTLALMAAKGEIGAPDCAIFADTGWEPRAVYEHLDRLERALPFPVHRVSKSNLRADLLNKAQRAKPRIDIPAYIYDSAGKMVGLANRSCTRDYKIDQINKKLRELLGYTGRRVPTGAQAEVMIGISLDEVGRMKEARHAWIKNVWPLIDLRISRGDCIEWLKRAGWTAPKSSCIGCPYHSDAQWRELTPEEFADAAEIDRMLRSPAVRAGTVRGTMYLHRAGKPLDEVDLSTAEDRGQLNLFINECEGICGV